MPVNTIIDAVRTLVAAATGVSSSQVHDGIRHATDEATFRSLFEDAANNVLHGWMVSYGGTAEEVEGHRNLNVAEHEIVIIGVYSVDDPGSGTSMTSEVTFRTAVENVRTELRQNITLTSTAMNSDPASVETFEHRVIRGVLVHYVDIRLLARERLQYTA